MLMLQIAEIVLLLKPYFQQTLAIQLPAIAEV